MIGIVLAAGPGKRLGALTDCSPKTLLPIGSRRSILDVILGNLKGVGIEEIAVVTGHQSALIEEAAPDLERRHKTRLRLIFNPQFEVWNNAYSLWCARDLFTDGALLVNGDTVHPQVVDERLIATRSPDLLLAVDRTQPVGIEAMKVRVSPHGSLELITKTIDVAEADGEYIGVAMIRPGVADALSCALEQTWRQDPSLYYEDAFQELVDSGAQIGTVPIDGVDWVEVDDSADLARAHALAGLTPEAGGPPVLADVGVTRR